MLRFIDMNKAIVISLEDLKDEGNTATSSNDTQILNTVTKSDFFISFRAEVIIFIDVAES